MTLATVVLLALACGEGGKDGPEPVDTGDRPPPTRCGESPCIAELAADVVVGDSYFGAELASAGDELYVGAPGYEESGTTVPTVRRYTMSGLTEVGRWSGGRYDRTGEDLSVADIDGDGAPEVAVARPGQDAFAHGSMVHILPSVVGDQDMEAEALVTIVGDAQVTGAPSVSLGRIAFTSDASELFVTGLRRDGTDARVHVFSTELRGTVGEDAAMATITSSQGLGQVTAWDGDADGQDDLTVQAVDGVYFFRSGWQATDLEQRDGDWTDLCAGVCGIGQVLEGVGDVTGDGAPDLAFSAPDHEEPAYRAGRAYLLDRADQPGPAADIPRQIHGEAEGEGMGFALGSADLDGDGQEDLVVSASGVFPSREPGVLLVYRGPVAPGTLTAAEADARVYGEYGSDLFVRAVVAVDLDGDAQDDLAVGAPAHPAGAGDGAVYLLAGSTLFP